MVDRELISRKLSFLESYIKELEQAEDIGWDEYVSDIRTRAFVERFLHLAIEAVFDLANHLVSFYNWREPDGYRDLMLILREEGVIPEEKLNSFQNMASFRNILVHRYDKIDDEIVFGVFKKRLVDFKLFVTLIEKRLAGRPDLSDQ